MTNLNQLIAQVTQLSTAEKWQVVKHLLSQLEALQTQDDKIPNWHEFIETTAGSLSDDPIERGDQGEYEEREPLE